MADKDWDRELAKIDKQLIDNVRFEFVKTTKRKIVVEVEKKPPHNGRIPG